MQEHLGSTKLQPLFQILEKPLSLFSCVHPLPRPLTTKKNLACPCKMFESLLFFSFTRRFHKVVTDEHTLPVWNKGEIVHCDQEQLMQILLHSSIKKTEQSWKIKNMIMKFGKPVITWKIRQVPNYFIIYTTYLFSTWNIFLYAG